MPVVGVRVSLSALCRGIAGVAIVAAVLVAAPAGACGQIFVTRYLTTSNNNVGAYTTSGTLINAALVTGLSGPEGIAACDG